MSYFIAGYQNDPSQIEDLAGTFIEVVPPEIRQNSVGLSEGRSFLSDYGADKVIKDIVIHDAITGSWLAILGTPLVPFLNGERSESFLNKFFETPGQTIKNRLDGCFAVLAFHKPTATFYAATDYDNTIPIFFAQTEKGLLLSSHELPLAKFLRSEIDPLGFAQTIHLKLTWGSRTRFKNIHKLLPCQLLTVRGNDGRSNDDRSTREIYWSPREETPWPPRFDVVLNNWLGVLRDSVRAYHQFASNKTVICDITAGEDSRLLVAQCHALEIPFLAMVDGLEGETDVRVAQEAAKKTGFSLIVRPRILITNEQLVQSATAISLMYEAYEDLFQSCTAYATDTANSQRNYQHVKLGGAPGGEVFRGSYYLRGKAFVPSRRGGFDYRFFTRMKYLLDFHPGLLQFSDEEFKETGYSLAAEALRDVSDFPIGIKIDHLLRVFQTCNTGLIYKNPRYEPFASKQLTRSIYQIPPNFKKGGRLTKACTEILYPELAWIRTQKGVPTVRRTLLRSPLFLPEYGATVKAITNGVVRRLFKWLESNQPAYQRDLNAPALLTLLKGEPFQGWFSSTKSMITGDMYNHDVADSLLSEAKRGASRNLPILGRMINQELACRWVYSRK